MIITTELTRDKILAYLNQTITLPQLVDWAENVLCDDELEAQNAEILRDIIARLGVADVREFGLTWADCSDFLAQLGYQAQVKELIMPYNTQQTEQIFAGQPDILKKGVDAIVQTGHYPSREAVLGEAFELFLLTHPQERLAMAIQLYQDEVVTLARAAQLANLNFFDFEAILRARGLEILTPDETSDEIEQGVALILGDQ